MQGKGAKKNLETLSAYLPNTITYNEYSKNKHMTQEKQMDKQGKNKYKIDTEYNYI